MRRASPAISRALAPPILATAYAALAFAALTLFAGCGSGSSGSGSTAATGTSTTTLHATAQTGLQPETTPKYAAPSPSSPVQSGLVQIAYRNIAIAPDTVRVKVGSTIRWTNYDSVEHNVTSEGGPMKFSSPNFGEGGTYELEVTKQGLIHYESTNFPATMNGSIEVVKG